MAEPIEAAETALTKYGEASEVKFGTPHFGEFIVVESFSATHSYQTNNQFKNEVGITVGQVLTDPKMEVTISGICNKQVINLGAVEEISTFVTGVEGATNSDSSSDDPVGKDVIITSIKQDNSNEDFMKFELAGERYLEVDVTSTEEVKKTEF